MLLAQSYSLTNNPHILIVFILMGPAFDKETLASNCNEMKPGG
jgi:hypothetical protein